MCSLCKNKHEMYIVQDSEEKVCTGRREKLTKEGPINSLNSDAAQVAGSGLERRGGLTSTERIRFLNIGQFFQS